MLIQELPQHLAENLEWSQVDMQRNVAWIRGDQAKSGKPIHVTLNATATAVLTTQIGKHPRPAICVQHARVLDNVLMSQIWHKRSNSDSVMVLSY